MQNKNFQNNFFKRHCKHFCIGFVFFGAGLFIGFFVFSKSNLSSFIMKRANDSEYHFINPLLTCNISENKEFAEYNPLKNSITSLINKSDQNKVSEVSVYYRDLNSGRWFSVNGDQTYNPASLLKVPLMIAYLKQAETNPEILSEKLLYKADDAISNQIEYYKIQTDLKTGEYYSVEELIKSMIYYSDNVATFVLSKNIDQNSLKEVMSDVGINLPKDVSKTNDADYLSVKSYSYLFRLLYNSTYLSRDFSEKALQLLSYVDFPEGVNGGLPKEITVSNKFGERTVLDANNKIVSRELHDCGIVYYPKNPYLLCVMTKGNDFDALSGVIKNVSSAIYNYSGDKN